MKHILLFLEREDGPTAVEYAVMLALILVACLVTIAALGDATAASFEDSQDQINNAISNSSTP